MPFVEANKKSGTTYGHGPYGSVCLLLVQNGLGDAIHCLPTVWQMKQDGYDVTVYCRKFQVPIWESIGVKVRVPEDGEMHLFAITHRHEYERILDFPNWGGWECTELGDNVRPQMEQFAELCESHLPHSFSWIDFLKPEQTFGEPYILYAPDSTERWRSIPHYKAREIFDLLEEQRKVLWLSESPEGYDLGSIVYQKTKCADFRELLSLVYNAEYIVTAENGVSNLAGALGKELSIVCSVTEPTQLIGQYRKYHSTRYHTVFGRTDDGCEQPCWRHAKNGFTNSLCQGQFNEPYCLVNLDVEKVLNSVPITL